MGPMSRTTPCTLARNPCVDKDSSEANTRARDRERARECGGAFRYFNWSACENPCANSSADLKSGTHEPFESGAYDGRTLAFQSRAQQEESNTVQGTVKDGRQQRHGRSLLDRGIPWRVQQSQHDGGAPARHGCRSVQKKKEMVKECARERDEKSELPANAVSKYRYQMPVKNPSQNPKMPLFVEWTSTAHTRVKSHCEAATLLRKSAVRASAATR